jgi:hypothetical protein
MFEKKKSGYPTKDLPLNIYKHYDKDRKKLYLS